MNREKITKFLPVLVLALGAAAAAVRGLQYLLAVDHKGLVVSGHPLGWLLWGICAVAAAVVIPTAAKLDGSNRYADNFGPSMQAAAGCFLLAVGIVLTLLEGNGMQKPMLVRLWQVSGLLSVLGLIWAGLSRKQGKRPFLLNHAMLCLFFALHMVSRYQPWCGNPQAQDWGFSLLAAVGLTLCAYHHSAFAAGSGRRRMFLAVSLLTVFLCCAALPHTEYFWLYLGGGIWAFTGLCRVTPVPKPEPAPETE